jgi:hypothetical protein
MDCHTDDKSFGVMNLYNPTVIKVKVKTCDAISVNGSTAACQGNPLKPNWYLPCGGPNDRVMPQTTRTIHFNPNVTYLVFSNGVGVKSYYRPKDAKGRILPWPVNHTINIPDLTTALVAPMNETELQGDMLHVRCKNPSTCLQLNIPGGVDSPFWKANGYKYDPKEHPECAQTVCGSEYPEKLSTVKNVQGYVGVDLVKYGKP